MAFHFPLMPRMFMALRREDRTPIVEIMARTPAIPDDCQWAIFLRNHDELTLEMVTDEERDYMYREYARDKRMRINVGIRRRLAPLMENGRRQIELMNALLMSMPGTPIVYYGDEIGMGDNVYLGDRNGVRTPMQWSDDQNAGFSEADSAALYSPVIVDPPYGYHAINVEAQERTPTSLLRWMRRLIGVRKEQKAFGRGTQEFLAPGEQAGARVPAPVRERGRALRQQPLALRAAGRARPARVRGTACRSSCGAASRSRRSGSCRTCSRWDRTASSGSASSRRLTWRRSSGRNDPRGRRAWPSCCASCMTRRWFGAKGRGAAARATSSTRFRLARAGGLRAWSVRVARWTSTRYQVDAGRVHGPGATGPTGRRARGRGVSPRARRGGGARRRAGGGWGPLGRGLGGAGA